ncbi:hypothetical protein [Urinicoccus massiliensis]|uniref:hypothetical protein n=1 Tax=Urinicoccus massiliensis TaxID=1723382 RepID=UPI000930156A|nr:hypothetical protein [Urinicoccus massiliensis]
MDRFKKFIKSRYGMDSLNKFLILASLVLSIFQGLAASYDKVKLAGFLSTFAISFFVFFAYRALSGNMALRRLENEKFRKISWPLRKNLRKKPRDKKYVYFTCPNCHKSLRAPKNLGKIRVTCKECHRQFEVRT